MERGEFKKGINDLKKVGLSPREKMELFARIGVDKLQPLVFTSKVKSNWYKSFPMTHLSYAGYATSFALIVLVFGAGAFYRAGSSLPGDSLYSLKVDVIEPLKYSMASDPIAKASIEVENIKTRVLEVETLESRGELSLSSQKDLEDRLKKHLDSFNSIAAQIETENVPTPTTSTGDSAPPEATFAVSMQTATTDPTQEIENISTMSMMVQDKAKEDEGVSIKTSVESSNPKNEKIQVLRKVVEEELIKYSKKHKLKNLGE